MKEQEAIDLIDTYGTDRKRWPVSARVGLAFDNLLGRRTVLKAHYDAAKKLDTALASWKEDEEDGAEIPDDDREETSEGDTEQDKKEKSSDEKKDKPSKKKEEPKAQGDGSGKEAAKEPQKSDDSEGDGDDEDGQMVAGAGSPMIDFSKIQDLDEMLANSLADMMFQGFDDRTMVCFTRDYDVIRTYNDKGGKTPDVEAVERSVKQAVDPMQKELQRLIVARSHAYMTPGFRRGRLNSAALHRVPTGDDRVFRRKQEAITNKVAMSLVIDNSGSMSGEKVVTAMKAAWAFAETLERIKVPCDVLGFTTGGEYPEDFDYERHQEEIDDMIQKTGISRGALRCSPSYLPIYKGFEEKFGPAQKRRMAHLISNQGILNANNDAIAIEYAGQRLLKRDETRKIMIVFSDGMPADGVDSRILNKTVVENVKRLERAGVEVIGIGIQTDAVRHFYQKHHVINNVNELPSFVMNQLRGLLTPR